MEAIAIYYYKARDRAGKEIKGSREGVSSQQVAMALQEEGLFPTDITSTKSLFSRLVDSLQLPEKQIKYTTMAIFCRQLAVMQEAGISLLLSLQQLADQNQDKKFKAVLQELIKEIAAGTTFSEAAERQGNAFHPVFINMIAVGEMSGTLDESLYRLAEHFEREAEIKGKIKTAMTYPMTISVVAVIGVIVLLTAVLPNFIEMLSGMGGELPAATRIVKGFSDFLVNRWYVLLFLLVLLVLGFMVWSTRPQGKYLLDKLKIQAPGFGAFTKNIILARFTRTFGTLLQTGVQILPALEIVSKVVDNEVVAQELEKCSQAVTSGRGLATPLQDSTVFPPMVVQMMEIGDQTGNLESLLLKVSVYYEREVDEMSERLSKMIEPILLIFLGGAIGFIIYSIMMPMFSVISGV